MIQILEVFQRAIARDGDAVMAWVQFIPLIIAAGKAAYGAIQAGKKNREKKRQAAQWNAENKQLFNQDYYSDYTQSAEAQNVIRQMRDMFDRQAKRDSSGAAVTGATIESQAAGKEARNRAMSNLMGNLGAMGTQRKERAKNRYLARQSQLQGLEYDRLNERAASAENLMNNGINSLGSVDWASIMGGAK